MATRNTAQTVEVNGLNLQYHEWGESRTRHALILLHGYGETSGIWQECATELAREYRVIALDQRGHPEIVTALVVIEAAPEVLRTGVENLRRLFASADEFTSLDDAVETFANFYPYATEEQLARRVRATVPASDEASFAWDFAPISRDATARPPEPDPGQRRMVNLWDCVERIQAPVMIVRGAETDMLTPEAIQRLHRRIPGSRVSLIEEAGHAVPSDQPGALGQHIREFLQSLTTGPS